MLLHSTELKQDLHFSMLVLNVHTCSGCESCLSCSELEHAGGAGRPSNAAALAINRKQNTTTLYVCNVHKGATMTNFRAHGFMSLRCHVTTQCPKLCAANSLWTRQQIPYNDQMCIFHQCSSIFSRCIWQVRTGVLLLVCTRIAWCPIDFVVLQRVDTCRATVRQLYVNANTIRTVYAYSTRELTLPVHRSGMELR